MGITLDLNNEQLKGIISEAILRSLDEGQRAAVLAQAIEHLTTPGDSRYDGHKRTPIQDAFNAAVRELAFREAQDQVLADENIRKEIADLLAQAHLRLLENKSDVIAKVANALTDALTADRSRF